MKEIKKGYRLKVTDYHPTKSFNKKYKFVLEDESGKELIFAADITQCEIYFEYAYKEYQAYIKELETEIKTYQRIIDNFQDRLDIKIKENKAAE